MTNHPITLDPGAWSVDAEASHARFTAATLGGLVKTPGHFRSLSGDLTIEQDSARGVLRLDAASIDTGNRLRDHHLRSRDFFAVAKHPELRYELRTLTAAGPDKLHLDGELTIAGRRTALPLDAHLHIHTDTSVEIAARTEVDRVALGVRGAPGMVPRSVELDIRVILRRNNGRP
jgi:polyisoprenoid-binding protein YceI